MPEFLDMDGPLMRVLSQIWDLIVLNLLTLLFCLPVVTAGAAFAAMHYIIIQFRRGEEGYIVRTFFREFKRNLKTATPLWILCLAAGAVALLGLRFLLLAGGGLTILAAPVLIACLVLFGGMLWLFPLTAKFENSLFGTVKNAFLMGLGALPRTLAMVLIQGLFLYMFTQVEKLVPAAVLAGFTLPAYLRSLVYYPVFQKILDAGKNDAEPDGPA